MKYEDILCGEELTNVLAGDILKRKRLFRTSDSTEAPIEDMEGFFIDIDEEVGYDVSLIYRGDYKKIDRLIVPSWISSIYIPAGVLEIGTLEITNTFDKKYMQLPDNLIITDKVVAPYLMEFGGTPDLKIKTLEMYELSCDREVFKDYGVLPSLLRCRQNKEEWFNTKIFSYGIMCGTTIDLRKKELSDNFKLLTKALFDISASLLVGIHFTSKGMIGIQSIGKDIVIPYKEYLGRPYPAGTKIGIVKSSLIEALIAQIKIDGLANDDNMRIEYVKDINLLDIKNKNIVGLKNAIMDIMESHSDEHIEEVLNSVKESGN